MLLCATPAWRSAHRRIVLAWVSSPGRVPGCPAIAGHRPQECLDPGFRWRRGRIRQQCYQGSLHNRPQQSPRDCTAGLFLLWILVVPAAIKSGVIRSRPQRQPANGEDMRSTHRIHAYLAAWAIGLLANLAHAELAPNPEAARPLRVGQRAPDFT